MNINVIMYLFDLMFNLCTVNSLAPGSVVIFTQILMFNPLYCFCRNFLFEHMIKDHGFNIGNPDNISKFHAENMP